MITKLLALESTDPKKFSYCQQLHSDIKNHVQVLAKLNTTIKKMMDTQPKQETGLSALKMLEAAKKTHTELVSWGNKFDIVAKSTKSKAAGSNGGGNANKKIKTEPVD